MSKKKITGDSKLASLAKEDVTPKEPEKKLRLVTRKMKVTPTSYRLTPEDKQNLKTVVEKVNELSPNIKITETMMIKALIKKAKNMKPEALLNMVRGLIS